jgi:hypothetical protein
MSYSFQTVFQMPLTDLQNFHKKLIYFIKNNEEVDLELINPISDITNEQDRDTKKKDYKRIKIVTPLNKKPLLNELRPMKAHFECCKVVSINATISFNEKAFGLKCLEITMKEKKFKDIELTDDKHNKCKKIITIYKSKVYESYHHYNNTTVGPLHYNLMKESKDLIVNTWCKNIFNNVDYLFSEKESSKKLYDNVDFIDD